MKWSKAESIKTSHPEAKPSSYFIQFLNLHFFLLPFRIEREPESGEYRFSSKPANLKAHKSLQKAIFFHHSDKRTSTTERLQLIALTQEIEIQPIGISCQFFTITTKFLSSTFGLFITYSIIIFQMSMNEKVFWEN
ncbi:unnamed protein product [Orchesella dallaii]|uniref:Uncharacterized protein n=1 Tax=Orchesella dallaii TaxID=48710 RepID=A0ABP1S3N0_9HEXA